MVCGEVFESFWLLVSGFWLGRRSLGEGGFLVSGEDRRQRTEDRG